MNFDIAGILENIFTVALQSVNIYIVTEHKRIGSAMELQVFDMYIVATPKHLVGIVHSNILQVEMTHLTEHLRSIYYCIAHFQMVAIPQCGASTDSKIAVFYLEAMNVPERIITFKAAVRCLNISTFLYCRLALRNEHIVEMQVVGAKERTLTTELLVFYKLHICCVFILLQSYT